MEHLYSKRLEEDTTQISMNRMSEQPEEDRRFLSQTPMFREKSVIDSMPVQIGHYRLLEQIGKGGMGTIYRVEHVFLKRNFAMKVINPGLLDEPNIAGYFSTETLLMGSLQHANIVQTTDAGNENGRLFIVMELLHGNDLAKHVKEHGPLPIGKALEFLRQAAQGLAAAHREGIVHRDVKPSNLFLAENGVVKLLDLGLAQSPAQAQNVHAGHLVGSPGFMAPEQILEGHSDARSDMYSLGCTFYFMLTGHMPFESPEYPDVKSVLDAQVEKEIPPLGIYRDDLNDPVEELVYKMTAKKSSQRFQTMEELMTEIEKPVVYIATKKKAGRPVKRYRFPIAVSAMILLLVAFGLTFSTQGNGFLGRCSGQACNRPNVKPISYPVKAGCQSEKCDADICSEVCPSESFLVCSRYGETSPCSTSHRECW